MNLKERTQLDLDIENIEQHADTFLRSIVSAIFSLNEAYTKVWSLPDDRLQAVLQYLYNNNKLQPLLENHYFAATVLNDVLERGNISGRTAINTPGKAFKVNDDGKIVLLSSTVNEPPIDEMLM